MKSWNPFSFEQWVIWIISTGAAGISGTIALLTFAEARFENKEQAALKHQYKDSQLEKIEIKLDKIDSKVDRLLDKSN